MRKHAIFFLLTIICSSCTVKQDYERAIVINIDSCLNAEPVSIYDLFDRIELIRLDAELPLSNTANDGKNNITTDGQLFYLLDSRYYTVNVYAQDGKALYKANNVGRGPGEYTIACQIDYNNQLNLIEILNPLGKILRYSRDSLRFVSEMSFAGMPLATHYAIQLGENYFLYSHSDDEQLFTFSENSEKPIPLGYDTPDYLRNYMAASSGVFSMDGKPCIFRPYDGQIFTIDIESKSLIPYIKWDFGKYDCKIRDIPKYKDVRDYGHFIVNYSEKHIAAFCSVNTQDEHIFATVVLKGKIYTLYYNILDKAPLLFNVTSEGMNFISELFYDNAMYKYVDASSLSSYINREILDDISKSAYDQVIQEDGAAIIKYTLRKSRLSN